jgi:hypothetical protein
MQETTVQEQRIKDSGLFERSYPLTTLVNCKYVKPSYGHGMIEVIDKRKKQETSSRVQKKDMNVTRKKNGVETDMFTLLGHNNGFKRKLTWSIFKSMESKFILLVKYASCMQCSNCKFNKRCTDYNLSFVTFDSLRQANKRLKPTHSGQIQKSKNVAKIVFDSIQYQGGDMSSALLGMLEKSLRRMENKSIVKVFHDCLGESFSSRSDCKYFVLIGKETGFPLCILKKQLVDNMILFMDDFVSPLNNVCQERETYVDVKKCDGSEWNLSFSTYVYNFLQANGTKRGTEWKRDGTVVHVTCVETLFLLNRLSEIYTNRDEYSDLYLVSVNGNRIDMDKNFIVSQTIGSEKTFYFYENEYKVSSDENLKEKEVDIFFMMESNRKEFMKLVNVTGCWSDVLTSQMLYAISDGPMDAYNKVKEVCGEESSNLCRVSTNETIAGCEFESDDLSIMLPQKLKGFSNNCDLFRLKDGTWEKQNEYDPKSEWKEGCVIRVEEKELSCFNFNYKEDSYTEERCRKCMLLIDIRKFLFKDENYDNVISYLLHNALTTSETQEETFEAMVSERVLSSLKRYISSSFKAGKYEVNLKFILNSKHLLFFLSACRLKNASKGKVGVFFSDGKETNPRFSYAYPTDDSKVCYLVVFEKLLLIGYRVGVDMDKNYCSFCSVELERK